MKKNITFLGDKKNYLSWSPRIRDFPFFVKGSDQQFQNTNKLYDSTSLVHYVVYK